MNLKDLYINYFISKGHKWIPSAPVVPENDPSVLFNTAGMQPLIPYLMGEPHPCGTRLVDYQKCIRTNDLDEIGDKTHHTFFEMLGNWSLGDYFKDESISYSFEFLTKVLNIPVDRLAVTVYKGEENIPFDSESYSKWLSLGIKKERIAKTVDDNFWIAGTSGPCGPDTEIFYFRSDDEIPDVFDPEDDRWVEIWNNVFMQYYKDENGNITDLPKKNVDTGMGLERLACVMQGVDNLFLVDTIQNIMKHISQITGVEYGKNEKSDVSLRVITDHIRSTTFMIGDGVLPSNEGKGYVLRRLLRRAARHGRLLGYNEPFLYKVCDTVIKENLTAYPELKEKQEFITKVIKVEEESFAKTIDQGFKMLNGIMDSEDVNVLSGEDAFKLNDTYGFPIDLTKEILSEKGIKVDVERFRELMKEQKKRSRDARKNAGADAWISDTTDLSDVANTEFVGYTDLKSTSKVLAIVKDGVRVDSIGEGENAIIVLDKTPFYGEGGGQVGDTGVMESGSFSADVDNTTKNPSGTIYLHACTVKSGSINVGAEVSTAVDEERRADITRNHTAAHLLQSALREVLGNHVQQAGQLVSDDYFRFDFTHFEALTAKELIEVQNLVNKKILEAIPVTTQEMPIEEAKKLGAMALFGEKYGDVVRVVSAGDFSVEFCGGTHVKNTANLGLFRIRQEGSVAAGVRRIEALTGMGVLKYINGMSAVIMDVCSLLKIANPKAVVEGVQKAEQLIKEQQREINELNSKLAVAQIGQLFAGTTEENGVRVVTGRIDKVNADILRTMCEKARDFAPKCVCVLATENDGKVTFAAACGKDALALGANAGKIIKAVAQKAGGNGGGKPDMAMAGAKQPEKISEALDSVKETVYAMLK